MHNHADHTAADVDALIGRLYEAGLRKFVRMAADVKGAQ